MFGEWPQLLSFALILSCVLPIRPHNSAIRKNIFSYQSFNIYVSKHVIMITTRLSVRSFVIFKSNILFIGIMIISSSNNTHFNFWKNNHSLFLNELPSLPLKIELGISLQFSWCIINTILTLCTSTFLK